MADLTPSQTVGPFFAYCLTPESYGGLAVAGNRLAMPETPGERVRIEGRVLDGDGVPIPDAMVEIWQADAEGRYAHPADARGQAALKGNVGFRGFGRSDTVDDGRFHFATVKPGAVAGPGGRMQAPHIGVCVMARGVLKPLFTRLYFEDDAGAHADDPVLALVPEPLRATLIARRAAGDGETTYRFDIRLQGEDETVFFAC